MTLPLRAVLLTACACALGSATTAVSGQTLQADDIAPFEVVYEVGNNIITAGSARLTLDRQDERWSYELSTEPTGVFKLTGRGRILETSILDIVPIDGGVEIQPLSYLFRQDDERQRSVDATFDWSSRTLDYRRRGKSGQLTFEEPILDRLSVTLAVMNAVRHDFEQVEFTVFDNGKLKTMRFTSEGMETLDTSMGKVETVRVRGENAEGSSRTTRTWFAPSLDFVPVQLEQHKRDKLVARMSLSTLESRVGSIELEPLEKDLPAE